MKTIGLFGGTGWISTVEYYRIINQEVNRLAGDPDFARIILYSINYGDVHRFSAEKNFDGIYSMVLDGVRKVIASGADCILLCANTMHMFADRIASEIQVPLLHIADATAKEIQSLNMKKVGLLGTKPTMEMEFYKTRLQKHGIEAIVPETGDRGFIHRTIDHELIKGIFRPEAKQRFLEIMEILHEQGAEGIILGCTEIPLLIRQEDIEIPLLNTLDLHAKAAAKFAME